MSLADDADRLRLRRGEDFNGIDTTRDRELDRLPTMSDVRMYPPEILPVMFPAKEQR
jgi:hypothetical protein